MKLHELQASGEEAQTSKVKKKVAKLTPGTSKHSKKKGSKTDVKVRSAAERLAETGDKDAAVSVLESVFFGEDD